MASLAVFFLSALSVEALVVNIDLNASGDPSRPANRRGVPYTGQGAFPDSGNNFWNIVNSEDALATSLTASDGATPTALNVTITGGSIFVDTDPADNDLLRDYYFQNTTTTIYGLEPDTSYTLYVYAVGDSQGQGSNITVGYGPGLETQNYLQQESQTLATSGDNTPDTFVLGGNYQVFTANSSPIGRLVVNSSNFINGIQVVGVDPLQDTEFVHPGLSHKMSDLERMKAQIEAQVDPWYSTYLEMVSRDESSFDYVVRGFEEVDPEFGQFAVFRNARTVNGVNVRTNFRSWEQDSRAAYYNALQWFITRDIRHAEKAREILNLWSDLEFVQASGTQSLTSCMGYIMIEAAELLKSTYSGWPTSEVQAFGDMLVFPFYSNTSIPSDLGNRGTWYWRAYQGDSNRAGNQDICGWRTLMAIGVFLDNAIIYDRGLRYMRCLTHRPDDLPYDSGPRVSTTEIATTDFQTSFNNNQLFTVPDHGFNGNLINYIWESGQCEESSRDQGHSLFGNGMLANIGEIAWNQGFDFYGAVDSRILLGLEYTLRYNVSLVQSFPDQPAPWEPTVASGEFIERTDATARTRSLAINPFVDTGTETLFDNLTRGNLIPEHTWEMPLAHYLGRGIKTEDDVKWTLRTRDYVIAESGEFEGAPAGQAYPGFGGLFFRRPEQCHGDPINGFEVSGLPAYNMPELPGVVEAENYDYFITEGQGRTYNDLSSGNNGNQYRNDEDVDLIVSSDLGGGFAVTDIEDGEWLSYTVNVLEGGNYGLAVRYASTQATQLRFAFDGQDVTGDVILPATGNTSTWETYTLARNISLRTGAQSMRLYFSASSSVCDLNQIIVTRENVFTTRIEAEGFDAQSSPTNSGGDGVTIRNFAGLSGGQHIGNISNGDWARYDNVSLEEGSIMRLRIAYPPGRPPGRVEARLDSPTGEVIGVQPLIETGSFNIYETFDLKLAPVSGTQSVFLVFAVNGASSTADMMNLDWLEFEVPNSAATVPATRIEAESFLSQSGISTESTQDVGGGQNVGRISNGDWLFYGNVQFGLNSVARIRLAQPEGRPSGIVEFRVGSPTGTLIGSRRLAVTGGFQSFATFDVPIDPSVTGNQPLYLVFNETGANPSGADLVNFNWFEIAIPPAPVAPNSISETPETASQILLTWEAVTGASEYRITRSAVGQTAEAFVVSPDELSFLDSNLVAGTQYFYSVTAVFNTFASQAASVVGVPSEPLREEETQLELTAIVENVNGSENVVLNAPVSILGHNYQISTTQDLSDPNSWQPATIVEAGTGNEINFGVLRNENEERRFYRMEVSRQ